ncbi:uncharacterized protein LOC135477612 isoform X1 [Liolophura sinensis]|uniref:uncharacterized protein LOC135477612 isoform X1 n=1 Tax=Liolophura sinensis TaxID=3198878 RepID=UPI00315993EA
MAIPSYHLLTFVLLITTMVSQRKVLADDCTKISACSCKNSQGTIDLSPLDSGGGDPKFKDIQSSDAGGNSFSWNPCTPFSEGDGTCTNVAACQVQPGSPPSYFSTGTQDSATFATDPSSGVLTLQYSATTDVTRTTYVTLTCDQSQDPGQVTATGEDPTIQAEYNMEYTGKYACPTSNPPSPTPSGGGGGGLSVGSILCIVFFALIIVYVAIGIVVQIFVRKASGKEIIPNVGFWSRLPGLVRDGTLFVVRRGQHPKKGYSDI